MILPILKFAFFKVSPSALRHLIILKQMLVFLPHLENYLPSLFNRLEQEIKRYELLHTQFIQIFTYNILTYYLNLVTNYLIKNTLGNDSVGRLNQRFSIYNFAPPPKKNNGFFRCFRAKLLKAKFAISSRW